MFKALLPLDWCFSDLNALSRLHTSLLGRAGWEQLGRKLFWIHGSSKNPRLKKKSPDHGQDLGPHAHCKGEYENMTSRELSYFKYLCFKNEYLKQCILKFVLLILNAQDFQIFIQNSPLACCIMNIFSDSPHILLCLYSLRWRCYQKSQSEVLECKWDNVTRPSSTPSQAMWAVLINVWHLSQHPEHIKCQLQW